MNIALPGADPSQPRIFFRVVSYSNLELPVGSPAILLVAMFTAHLSCGFGSIKLIVTVAGT